MRYLSGAAVRAAIAMPEAIRAMATAFAHEGRAVAPPRAVLATDAGHTLVMPAYLAGSEAGAGRALAVKVVSVIPANPGRGLPRIVGAVVALDPDTGELRGVLHGATVTAIRTAAVSGLATDLLARPDAGVLAVLGAGALAADHVAAIAAVRALRDVRVYAPTRARAEALAARTGARVVDDAAAAVRGADVVVTLTTSTTPVFDDRDLAEGAHVCAVGAWRPSMQEIPAATMARAAVFVDDAAAAWEESGDLVRAHAEGAIGRDHVAADLADVVLGRHPGRTGPREVTLFESVGLAIEDAALAAAALAGAEARGLGVVLDAGAPPGDGSP